jgi:hypothetical protein
MVWDAWKKSFDTWEDRTAKLLEVALKSPVVLRPAAAALTAGLRAKAAADKVATYVVGHMGLPTKADQERALHAIYRLESRIIDLEEKLDAEREEKRTITVREAKPAEPREREALGAHDETQKTLVGLAHAPAETTEPRK